MKTISVSILAVFTAITAFGCNPSRENTNKQESTNIEQTSQKEEAPKKEKPEESKKEEAPKNEKAPELFQAKFETTAGDFVIEVHREWAPIGADRFYNLVKAGFYDDCRFFRVIPDFMAQFGDKGDPDTKVHWKEIKDDRVMQSNTRGYVTFAKTGAPNSRTTQLFINFEDNSRLDRMGFAPFGKVVEGMDAVNKIYGGYGQLSDSAMAQFQSQGNKFLQSRFPKMDAIKQATIVEDQSAK